MAWLGLSCHDEFNLTQAWQAFQCSIMFLAFMCSRFTTSWCGGCTTAKDTDQTNLADGFEITGLGEFMAMALKADRVVTL